MALGVTDLKKGQVFVWQGAPYKVVEYAQKVVGRGGSIVNVKVKSLIDGRVSDKTFKGNDQLEPADITNRSVQYLYGDGGTLHFMDTETYEQFELAVDAVADQIGYLKEGEAVQAQFFNGRVIAVELPKNVSLRVAYTENVVKGDTTTSVMKDAWLETGVNVKVPAFIKTGDIISVDTASGTYRERVK